MKHRDKVECKFGHPYDKANTFWTPTGARRCRECARKRMREMRARDRRDREKWHEKWQARHKREVA